MFNNDPDTIYSRTEKDGGATEKKNDARIPKRDDAPKTNTTTTGDSGHGCAVWCLMMIGAGVIVALGLVLRVM